MFVVALRARGPQPSPSARMDGHRPTSRVGANDSKPFAQIVELLIPAVDIGPRAARRSEAALVIRLDVETRGSETVAEEFIPSAVLGDPVDEEDVRPRRAGRRPTSDEKLRPVGRSRRLGG